MVSEIMFRYEVPFGHRLMFHEGKCRYPHGHNYVFEISVSGPLNSNGMVLDFSVLKDSVKRFFEPFDHAFVLYKSDPLLEWFRFMKENHRDEGPAENVVSKVVVLDAHPTAEILARLAAESLGNSHPDPKEYSVFVTCFEQENCSATAGTSQDTFVPSIVETW